MGTLPNILTDMNCNLTNLQKKLLMWHHSLGVSMQYIQHLMKVANVVEPCGRETVKDRIIAPKYNSAVTCEISKCQSCQLLRAKQLKSKPVKSKAIKDAEGAITRDKYQTGDFVSMDQYVVKNGDRLPAGYGREHESNEFHGGTLFRDAASKYIYVQKQVSLGADETVTAKREFEEWLREEARVAVKHFTATMESSNQSISLNLAARMARRRALVA